MCWVMDWDLWAECVIMIYCRAVFHAILISIGRGARAGLQCHHRHICAFMVAFPQKLKFDVHVYICIYMCVSVTTPVRL